MRPSVLRLALVLATVALPVAARAQGAPASPIADSVVAVAPPGMPAQADSASVIPAPAAVTTPAPAFSARPTVASKRVRLTGKPENVIRSGPGSGFAMVATFPPGATFPVIAKSGAWYGIRVSDTETGWIHASLCKELDDLTSFEYKPNPRLYTRTGAFVLGGYGGAYAYDRKSNSAVLGGRLGYYVFDRVVAEAGVSWTHVRRPAEIVESLFGLTLEAEDFSMLFYHLNATWELLPGRQMVPYVGAGMGSALMLGRSTPSWNFGAGTRLFLSRKTAMRWDVRDFRFTDHTTSAARTNNNVEFTLGTEIVL
jgi:outer membrane beta-barrel protein